MANKRQNKRKLYIGQVLYVLKIQNCKIEGYAKLVKLV